MHLALSALKEEGATVAQVGSRFGYRSEAAFSRAFKRVVGVSPGAVSSDGAGADAGVVQAVAGSSPVAHPSSGAPLAERG
jgi:AraC-like DNA-binding protein